jgi:hypothetical protein
MTRLTEHSENEWRAFYRQQADRLLELARGCDRSTARTLTAAAIRYLNKLEPPLSGKAPQAGNSA